MKYIVKTSLMLALAQNAYSGQEGYLTQAAINSTATSQETNPEGSLPPAPSTAPLTTLVAKTCQGGGVVLSDDGSLLQAGKRISVGEEKCVVPQHDSIVAQFDKRDFLNKSSKKLMEVSTRLEANLQDISDLDKDIISVISSTAVTGNPSLSKDFYANINPETIKFMFSLCVRSYYDKNYGLNQNNESSDYQKMMNQQNAMVRNLEAKLNKVAGFKQFMVQTFGQETIGRLQKKRVESQKSSDQQRNDTSLTEGRYGQNLGFITSNTPDMQGFEHNQGGDMRSSGQIQGTGKERSNRTETEVQDLEIRSFAPELVRAIAQQYNATFNTDSIAITDTLTLSDIEERVNRLSLETENALVDARRSQRIFADKRVGEFWAKLDSVFDRQADGFMPIDVLYRNLVAHKDPLMGLASGLINSKQNTKTDLGGKEFSGIILYRPDNSNAPQKVDQLILAFSGSNSAEDWKHNLDAFTKEGKASVNLAAGLRVHSGIMSSLEDSLQETGTKMKSWFKNYADLHPANSQNKPTLRIYLTGHSLGGALAQLMAVYVKQNIEPYIKDHANLEVIVYTFGAPPIFDKDSAPEVESMLGKQNIVRVWNVGDPVAAMSILKKTEKIFERSPIMVLLGYRHVGMSVPLYDTTGVGEIWDKLNPWKYHLADRYNNLIQTNWKELLNRQANQVYGLLLKRGLLEDEKLKDSLEKAIEFVRYPTEDAVLAVDNITPAQLVAAIVQKASPQTVDKTIGNYDTVVQQRHQQRETQAPKLAKAETKDLTYTHMLPTGLDVNMGINRSTSCDIKNIASQSKIDLKSLSEDDSNELSCGCCLSKNFFVSDDSSVASKLRGVFAKKKISTVQEVYNHCQKYCKPLEGKKFTAGSRVDLKSINNFMVELGLGDMWLAKKLR